MSTDTTPLVSDERKPLSYYMKNAMWYFGQPPDPISGQVVPRSTVESWLERTEEMEADRSKLIADRDALVEKLRRAKALLQEMVAEADFKEKVAGGLGHFERPTMKSRAFIESLNNI